MRRLVIKANGNKFVHNHNCSFCEVPVGWVVGDIERGELYYKSACSCTEFKPEPRIADIQEIVDWHNMQTDRKAKGIVIRKIIGAANDVQA